MNVFALKIDTVQHTEKEIVDVSHCICCEDSRRLVCSSFISKSDRSERSIFAHLMTYMNRCAYIDAEFVCRRLNESERAIGNKHFLL